MIELTGMQSVDTGSPVNLLGIETLTTILSGLNLAHKVEVVGIRVTGVSI